MTPRDFCQKIMAEYESQWSAAAGHQERHPLRVKIRELDALISEAGDAEQFTRLLAEGAASCEPFRQLLCTELVPLWDTWRERA